MKNKELIYSVGYMRTSSSSNVGEDRDSDKRQKAAIQAYVDRAGYEIVEWYYDAAVKGADPVDTRPGFKAMLERLLSNGVRTIIVETANRFARDLIVQETGYKMLQEHGIALIAADSPEAFVNDTPTAVLIRQILGAVSQFEKAMLVSKLKGARDRKRAKTGRKVGGRQNYAEININAVVLAKRLHRYPVNNRHRTLREVSAEMAGHGIVSSSGKPYAATAISKMIATVISKPTGMQREAQKLDGMADEGFTVCSDKALP
jgi:DNA invertase Pin-like site-specific DNA recombinase